MGKRFHKKSFHKNIFYFKDRSFYLLIFKNHSANNPRVKKGIDFPCDNCLSHQVNSSKKFFLSFFVAITFLNIRINEVEGKKPQKNLFSKKDRFNIDIKFKIYKIVINEKSAVICVLTPSFMESNISNKEKEEENSHFLEEKWFLFL